MQKSATQFEQARGAGDAFLGVEVSWDMGDHARDIQIDRGRCELIFLGAGADQAMFTPRPTPETSLAKATRIGWSQRIGVDSRIISVKQLSKPDRDTPLAFGVYYRISEEGERDRWEIGARVRVVAGLAVASPPQESSAFSSSDAEKWAREIAQYANDRPRIAFNSDVSDFLVTFGAQLGWVTRRGSGGVYFLPGDLGECFMSVIDALEMATSDSPVSFQGNATPQYADPRTLQTWQRRTTHTIESEITTLREKLTDMVARDNVRSSTFDLRVMECGALIQRAETFSAILQNNLGPIKETLVELKNQFGDAQQKMTEAKVKADTAFAGIEQMGRQAAPQQRQMPDQASLDRLFGE